MKSRILLFAFAGVLFASTAQARLDCNGIEPEPGMNNVALAQVIAKASFVKNESDGAHCPSADAACRRRGFLLPGDIVVGEAGTGAAGSYGCIAYVSDKGVESDGWFPVPALRPLTLAPSWAGKWMRDTSSEIDITVKGAAAHVSGSATGGENRDAPNEGDIDAAIDARAPYAGFAISGDKQLPFAKAGPDDCAVEMRQLGPYLLVQDNNNCGGMDVTFSGLYRKR